MKTNEETPELPDREEFLKNMIASMLEDWINGAYTTTLSGLTQSTNPQTAVEEMRWLHLSQPHLIAMDIYNLLKMAGAIKE